MNLWSVSFVLNFSINTYSQQLWIGCSAESTIQKAPKFKNSLPKRQKKYDLKSFLKIPHL